MSNFQVEIETHRVRNSTKEKESQGMRERCENEIEKLQCSINSKNNAAKKMKVQEIGWKHKTKDVEK